MPTTVENLAVAFAGESQANRKYLAFARQAEKEGLPQIARLFRAAAEAETLHAHAHLANMGGVGSTRENLEAAVKGETYEFTEMYPPMVEQAKAENHKAKTMLGFAASAAARKRRAIRGSPSLSAWRAKARYLRLAWLSPAKATFRFSLVLGMREWVPRTTLPVL